MVVRDRGYKPPDDRGAAIDVSPSYMGALRGALAVKGLKTYRAMAERTGVSKSQLQRFFGSRDGETKPEPTDKVARALCDAAGIPYPLVALNHPSEMEVILLFRTASRLDPAFMSDVVADLAIVVTSTSAAAEVKQRWKRQK